ncbi:hypothetical protein [Heyndrickxia sporothermodurans]|uniref:hypothetical protein n=1 Tax=Heyndrickxia sporothermodurans TaxID=46224 RepID=UPI000D3A8813|nr:hypothetical protein [Heyndrickxia sporothermodurans]PTY93026.1 hypothetical protein B5V90_02785 [Heyndrickxia sporothermodurans]
MFRRKKPIEIDITKDGGILVPQDVIVNMEENVSIMIRRHDAEESAKAVGTVSPELMERYKKNMDQKKAIRTMLDEIQDRLIENDEERQEIWSAIYDELGIDKNQMYRIDPKTGEVESIDDFQDVEAWIGPKRN